MQRMMIAGVMLLGALVAWPTIGFGQVVDAVSVEKPVGTARQQQWLAAKLQERVRLAETLGENGARAMARTKGYESLHDGLDRLLPQGPDQVYRAADGRVIVYEAKGGSSRLGNAYGHPQGSAEWAIESAKRVLRSPKAGGAERAAAQEILVAAAKGRLEVHVIRTKHVLGEPIAAVLEGGATTTDEASRMARGALDDLVRSATAVDDVARTSGVAGNALRPADDIARVSAEGGSVLKTVSKAAVPVAVVVDVGIRVHDSMETERQFAAGEISVQQREVTHAKNAAGMAGGWGCAAAGAEASAVFGGMVGGPWGAAVCGLFGGIGGYIGGEAVAEDAAEWTVNQIHATGTTISESARGAWTSATRVSHSAADGVSHAWNWAWGK